MTPRIRERNLQVPQRRGDVTLASAKRYEFITTEYRKTSLLAAQFIRRKLHRAGGDRTHDRGIMRWNHIVVLVRWRRFGMWDGTWDFLAHSESHSLQKFARDHVEIGCALRWKTIKIALDFVPQSRVTL